MKQYVYFTKEVKEFILGKMCEGLHPSAIVRLYPNDVPSLKEIYRRASPLGKDPKFSKDYTECMFIYYQVKQGELDELTSKSALELYPHLDPSINDKAPKDGWKQAEATRRARIDVLKFDLGKLAPIFSARYDKADKVELQAKVDNTVQLEQSNVVNVIDYSVVPTIESK